MKPPRSHARRLSAEEAALWARVAQTVTPIEPGRKQGDPSALALPPGSSAPATKAMRKPTAAAAAPSHQPSSVPAPCGHARQLDSHGLDGNWDRKLVRGIVQPDFTLDLHGCTLDQAHSRLDHGLSQALAMGARVVLLITGRERPADSAGRGERRGAIRAKFRDWLEAGPHASRIAAIRAAHPRHGGGGAVYVVLRRGR